MKYTNTKIHAMNAARSFIIDEGTGHTIGNARASTSHTAKIQASAMSGEGVPPPGLLTVKEAAIWLAISPATCYRLMERGTLRSLKIGGARRVRLSDLQALITQEI